MSMPNVLLTGGTGYIGSHTAAALLQAGYGVVLLDNLSNSNADAAARVGRAGGREAAFVQGDIADTGLVANTLAVHKCEAVLHFAGYKAVGESVAKPLDYYQNNVAGTISLLQAMRSLQVRSLVFSSSATVYGEPEFLPITEAHPTRAVNPYGRTKLQIEEMLSDLARAEEDWSIACLRYFNPVGAHPSGLLGESPRGTPNNLMPYVTKVAAGELPVLRIFGGDYRTPDGTGVRDYIHVCDLADGHVRALEFLVANRGWHAVNLGTGRGFSVLEVVATFERVTGMRIPREVVGRRAGDVPSCYADPSKAERLFGWRAVRGLDEMCASAWDWQRTASKQDR